VRRYDDVVKRRALRIGLFLVLGAIVNVAAAWTFLNVVPVWDSGMFGPDTVDAEHEEWWQRHRPTDALGDPDGLNVGLNAGALVERIYPFDDSPECILAIRARAGWPSPSLIGGVWQTHSGRHIAATDAMRPTDRVLLPVRPLWPGFLINTLFYAAILWLLFAIPGRIRRTMRLKRGLCPKCAYPLGSSDLCTECGAPRTRPRKRAVTALRPAQR
jgi:hypothetical protein